MINEKKLTPAELKKREEIAQAIEKDQPDMPMDKKMAIATATAKKVAEELHPNQQVLDVDKDGKIDSGDLADVRKGKHKKKMSESDIELEKDELDEAEQWELKKIHGEYKHLKSLPTADVLKKHKALQRVSASYTAAEMGGKEGLISDIMSSRHGSKRMDAYHALPKKHKNALSSLQEGEILEYAVGTKVHHPFLGHKGGVVVKPPHNGFNHVSGVRSHENHIHVDAGNGKIYKFAAHSLKRESTMTPKQVVGDIISSKKAKVMKESVQVGVISFKEYSDLYEDVLMESSPFDMSRTSWMTGNNSMKAGDAEKKGVGRPAGDYGSYKIDKSKRDTPEYKAQLSAKVKAAKADGFEARKQFKDLMNTALKKREKELFGEAADQVEEASIGDDQLVNSLRASWGKIDQVDPSSNNYKKLVSMLNSLDQGTLKTLMNANIKFVSGMARNRYNK